MKRINTQEFIDKLKNVQPKLRVIGEYVESNTLIKVKDELGIEYFSKPYNLLGGKVPNLSTAIDKTKAFNIRLKRIFPNLEVKKYKIGKEKIIVTDDLNIEYLVSPSTLLLGRYPSIQTAIDKNKAFSILANNLHTNLYDYSKVNYLGMNNKVTIICKQHGEFFQEPSNHLQGQGCRDCADELMSNKGWTKENWILASNKFKDNNPKLYILKLYNNIECFIKVGITFTTIHKRFINKLPYSYEVIKVIENTPDIIFDLEKEYHNKFKEYKYIPKIRFGGMYECYKYSVVKEILIKEKII